MFFLSNLGAKINDIFNYFSRMAIGKGKISPAFSQFLEADLLFWVSVDKTRASFISISEKLNYHKIFLQLQFININNYIILLPLLKKIHNIKYKITYKDFLNF